MYRAVEPIGLPVSERLDSRVHAVHVKVDSHSYNRYASVLQGNPHLPE
jgi:hypothetical protein